MSGPFGTQTAYVLETEPMIVERPSQSTCMRELIRMLTKSKVAYERAYDKTRNRGLHDLYGALASTHVPMIHDLESELAHFELLGISLKRRKQNRFVGILREIREPAWLLGDEGILVTVHRTESSLLAAYERHLLQPELPASAIEVLSRHRSQLRSNLQDIEMFVDHKASFA